jgi:hypothetical protein
MLRSLDLFTGIGGFTHAAGQYVLTTVVLRKDKECANRTEQFDHTKSVECVHLLQT